MSTYLQSIDWQPYLEREIDLFSFFLFSESYGHLLENATGFKFEHQLHEFSNGKAVFYRSKKELEAADKHFAKLLEENKETVSRLLQKEKECHELVGEMNSENNPAKLIEQFKQIVLYNTVIPFRLLSSVPLVKKSEFQGQLEKIRKTSLYPKIIEQTMDKLFQKVAKILQTPKRKARLLTPNELIKALSGEILITEQELDKRNAHCYFHLLNNKVVYVDEIPKIETDLIPKSADLYGNSAHPGKVKGIVQIINKPQDISRFKEGNILVTLNGNPSISEALLKASAIIADEGGITCHAAIVSREIKIPCIIGTQHATKILKEGNLVEVNADKGIIKILKSKKDSI